MPLEVGNVEWRRPPGEHHLPVMAQGARCDLCPLSNAAMGPIPATIPYDGEIPFLVVGEAPGNQERDAGKPFVGPSGRMVREALADGGLPPEQAAYTNAMSCMPIGGDLTKFLRDCKKQGRPSPIDCCKPRLMNELARARFALFVGGASLRASGLGDSAMKARGAPIILDGRVAGMSTLHPAYVMRDSGKLYGAVFQHDVAKAVRLFLGGNTWTDPAISYDVNVPNLQWLARQPYIAVDVETDGKDPWTCGIRRIGMGTVDGAFIYRWLLRDGTDVSVPETTNLIRQFLAEPLPFVFHNFFGFDSIVLAQHGLPVNETNLFDTLLGHHLGPTSEYPHRLDFLGSTFTDAPKWKDMTKHEKRDT